MMVDKEEVKRVKKLLFIEIVQVNRENKPLELWSPICSSRSEILCYTLDEGKM